MAVAGQLHPALLSFLSTQPKRMLIDGKWVDAASGKAFETINPATGEVLASVAEADREDIDRAVKAARRAFHGEWAKVKPADRQRLLLRLADLVEANGDELAMLEVLDNGMPITMARRTGSIGRKPTGAASATTVCGVRRSAPHGSRPAHFMEAGPHPVQQALPQEVTETYPCPRGRFSVASRWRRC